MLNGGREGCQTGVGRRVGGSLPVSSCRRNRMRFRIQSSRAAMLAGLLAGVGGPAAGQRAEPCPSPGEPGTGVVQGVVTDLETRVPLRAAEVQLSWRREGDRRQRTLETLTDRSGIFRFCDAPGDAVLLLKASFAGKNSRSEPVQVTTSGQSTVELQIEAPHSEIVGRVVEYNSGRPISNATVRLKGTPLTQVTPQDGKFRFSTVPPGMYDIDVQHLAYRVVSDSVELERGTNMDVTVRLAPNVIPLDPLVVTVRSMMLERYGFYERQQRGHGDYVSRGEIERQRPILASELLRTIPGIRLTRRSSGIGYAPVGRADCGFRYVLNGARVGPGFEIDDISPDWIEAIEVYRGISTVPIEFSVLASDARAGCGVIVIWTRSR